MTIAPIKYALLGVPLLLVFHAGCKTRSDIRREGELKNLREKSMRARSEQVELEQDNRQLKQEVLRLNGLLEAQNRRAEQLQQQIAALQQRVSIPGNSKSSSASSSRSQGGLPSGNRRTANYELAKRQFESGKYSTSVSTLKEVLSGRTNKKEAKKARFLLAEAYFANRDYAMATLEFDKFKRLYPKDALIPRATFRQALCFKNLGKRKEAKLFYREVIDQFPKSPQAKQAKKELRKLN